MSPAAHADSPTQMVKPFVWLGVTGFLIGFALCLALSAGRLAADHGPGHAAIPAAAEPPPPVDDWKGERIT